ncbi:MAG: hypothetical protein DCC75_01900 [Proteobacteria bacterium]|nr:MAG: hypothetical protein DCC75_01900 [Pseudomonadota bacterium]
MTGAILLSGILLTALLPVGLFAGTAALWFDLLFAAHLFAIIFALFASAAETARAFRRCSRSFQLLFAAAALFFTAVIVRESLLPITAKDALIHHLAVPKWWIQAGKIHEISWHEWSYYPMLMNLAYTGLLSWGLEWLTPFYHLTYLLLLCSVTGRFFKDPKSALTASVVTLSLPICMRLASTPLVDLGLCLYSAIALLSAAEFLQGRKHGSAALTLGLAWGLALASKLNAILACVIFFPLLFAFALTTKLGLRRAFQVTAVSSLLALAIYSPWLIKNYSWTGNPVFPLYKSLFGNAVESISPRGLNPLEQRVMLYEESWLEVAALPIRVFVQGEDENPKLFDGRLSPYLLLALLFLFMPRKGPDQKLLLYYSLIFLLLALTMHGARVRYLVPILPSLIVLSVQMGSRFLPQLFFAIHLAWGAHYAYSWIANPLSRDYFASKISREAYLQSYTPEFETIRFINSNLPEDSRIYLLFTGNRFYYYDRPVISAGHQSGNQIIAWLRSGQDEAALRNSFGALGATHLLAHSARTIETFRGSLTEQELAVWSRFATTYLAPVGSHIGYELSEVRPPGAAASQ